MKDIAVVKVHNASVSAVYSVDTVEEGKALVRDLFEYQFGRSLNDEEVDDLENLSEIFTDGDHDNTFTFSITPVTP